MYMEASLSELKVINPEVLFMNTRLVKRYRIKGKLTIIPN
ncbi:hypothetical protein SAMN02746066_03956 [Anaerosporobacter mobilis DSM 15930]|jgi:hypothetical protein|uniref:Uncharacterized protein n=1 Tax=Anaerosporobacter mobilis DSM 15930 TaxID=1120996 RepID=A0A1M7MQ66_9FIRM|nr:hypothetical protein SAMN02746066_03956 [Anaerosporobacter mobilis DSM 15930]